MLFSVPAAVAGGLPVPAAQLVQDLRHDIFIDNYRRRAYNKSTKALPVYRSALTVVLK